MLTCLEPAIDGNIWSSQGSLLNDVWLLDIASWRWVRGSPLGASPTGREGAAAAVLAGTHSYTQPHNCHLFMFLEADALYHLFAGGCHGSLELATSVQPD